MKQIRFSVFVLLIPFVALLVSCGGSSSDDGATVESEAIRNALATEVVATITAEAGVVSTSTSQPQSTNTPVNVAANVPTWTPTAATPKPTVTNTPRPQPTSTAMPGIGDSVTCGSLWQIGAISAPDFSGIITEDPPKGAYASLYFKLKNLQSQTDSLSYYSDNLQLIGTIEKRDLLFDATRLGTSRIEKERGIATWVDDIPPLVEATASAVFDVNPTATNWRLRLTVDPISGPGCTAEIALFGTRAATATGTTASTETTMRPAVSDTGASSNVLAIINQLSVNFRMGPGTNYALAGQGTLGQELSIQGRTAASDWYQVCCVNGQTAWIAAFLVETLADVTTIPVVADLPATPIPPPTPAPLSKDTGIGAAEVQVQNWGLRLYDVKKAKTVYYYGSGEYAAGVWLIALVEFRNLGTGTDKPNASLDFYLQDAAGRTFEYDFFNSGDLAASWQFQAGHIYDRINPGSVLGIALPWDVSPDLGDMWLRVEQNPNIAIYLGNVSQLPQEN